MGSKRAVIKKVGTLVHLNLILGGRPVHFKGKRFVLTRFEGPWLKKVRTPYTWRWFIIYLNVLNELWAKGQPKT